jgi:hypothetical protein
MVEILRFRGNDAGRRGEAARLVVASDCLRVCDEEDLGDEPSRLRARVAELEAMLEVRRGERARLLGLLRQFLAARERELAAWREELERERAGHARFVDDLRAKHAEEWSRLDDERSALAARLAASNGPGRPLWRALFAR